MSTKEPVSLDSLAIGGVNAPDDSLLNTGKTAISQIYLPLRSRYSSAAFYFKYLQKELAKYDLADTIWLDYTSEPYFASEECGAMYRYKITKCSHTSVFIDSVAIVDSLITNVDIQRIQIYFRTAVPDE